LIARLAPPNLISSCATPTTISIAGILNRNGLVTGYGNRWTRERVTSLRSYHGIAV
jgi:hypothetical protein